MVHLQIEFIPIGKKEEKILNTNHWVERDAKWCCSFFGKVIPAPLTSNVPRDCVAIIQNELGAKRCHDTRLFMLNSESCECARPLRSWCQPQSQPCLLLTRSIPLARSFWPRRRSLLYFPSTCIACGGQRFLLTAHGPTAPLRSPPKSVTFGDESLVSSSGGHRGTSLFPLPS
jgi:hypothetical protein